MCERMHTTQGFHVTGRGIYEVTETYGQESGGQNTSPWTWNAAGQHLAWLAIQAAGVHATILSGPISCNIFIAQPVLILQLSLPGLLDTGHGNF